MKLLDREKTAYFDKINKDRKIRSVKNGTAFFKYAFILMVTSYFVYPDTAKFLPDDTPSSIFITLIICSGSIWVAFLLIKPIQFFMSKINVYFRQ